MADVLDLTRKLGREPNLETAVHIMMWELGDLAKMVTYMKWHDEALRPGFRAEATLALSSLIFQARVCCELLGFNFGEALEKGVSTVMERAEHVQKKLGRHAHYVGDKKE